jgi:hypothetical protein
VILGRAGNAELPPEERLRTGCPSRCHPP